MRGVADKVVLVTGGASGLGKAIAERLVAEGARVIITDVQAELGGQTAEAGSFAFLEQDVSHEGRWDEVVAEVEGRFGRLDALVNNAGIGGSLEAVTPENTDFAEWKRLFSNNVDSVFLGCRAAIPALRRAGGGSIVNMSSMAAMRATPHATAYGAGKAAIMHLTRSVAQYCAQARLAIRCNSLHPGYIRTPSWDRRRAEMARLRDVSFEEQVEAMRSAIPLGDFTRAEDVGATAAFLISDESRHMTGTGLMVDGGIVHCDSFRPGG